MTKLLEGKPVTEHLKLQVKQMIGELDTTPLLAVLLDKDNFASVQYIQILSKLGDELGIVVQGFGFDGELADDHIFHLMNSGKFHGVLPMMPLPLEQGSINTLYHTKDIDGLTATSQGLLMQGNAQYAPCTPKAVMEILDFYDICVARSNVCIIGRSNVVGKPLAQLLTMSDATVTLCHSKTFKSDLREHIENADIVISAIGKPYGLDGDMFHSYHTVIDIGINELDGKIVGDIAPSVLKKVSAITPVPNGVGTVCSVVLLKTLVERMKGVISH